MSAEALLVVDPPGGSMSLAPGVRTVKELEELEHLRSDGLCVDCRKPQYVAEGTIPGALAIPHHDVIARRNDSTANGPPSDSATPRNAPPLLVRSRRTALGRSSRRGVAVLPRRDPRLGHARPAAPEAVAASAVPATTRSSGPRARRSGPASGAVPRSLPSRRIASRGNDADTVGAPPAPGSDRRLRDRAGLSNAQLARRSYVTPQSTTEVIASRTTSGRIAVASVSRRGGGRLADDSPLRTARLGIVVSPVRLRVSPLGVSGASSILRLGHS